MRRCSRSRSVVVLVGALLVSACSSGSGTTNAVEPTNDASPESPTVAPTTTVERTTTVAPTTTVERTTTVAPTTTVATFDALAGRGGLEVVADGFGLIEGPQWSAADGVLLFSEPQPIDDGPRTDQSVSIWQLGANDEISPFRRSVDNVNGLAVDPEGRLVAVEPSARRIVRIEADGTVTVLADTYEGKRFNGPNDIIVRSDGTIYFTDPLLDQATTELGFGAVFRISPDGDVTLEHRGDVTEFVNGIALSPDERRLFVAQSFGFRVLVFDLADDGSSSDPRPFVDGVTPDGIAVDSGGNLFVANIGVGIEVVGPDGTVQGTIDLPNPQFGANQPTNVGFGGADGRTLYITAQGVLYAVQLEHPGLI